MKMETMVPTAEKMQAAEMLEILRNIPADNQQAMLAYLQGIQMGQQLANTKLAG